MNADSSSLTLGGARVDLWRIRLSTAHDPAHESILAPDEMARARRYLSATVRQRFITSRAMLRAILADYLDANPRAIQFVYGTRGKPALGGQWADHTLRFNVSHSEDCLLVGVTWHRAIGVDVEYLHTVSNPEQIAAQFFSPAEYATYRRAPDAIKRQAFFNCWTRKEAYIKARGDGLAIPLDSFDVTLLPGESAQLTRTTENNSRRWALYAESPVPDYVAAVAVEDLIAGR